MAPSIQTLLAAVAVLTAFDGLVLLAFRLIRRTYPGFREWMVASWALAVGYGLLSSRGFLPGAWSVVVANTLFPTAAMVRLDSVARFLRGRRIARAWWALPGLALLATGTFYYWRDDATLRTAIIAVGVCIPAALATLLLLRQGQRPSVGLRVLTAAPIAGLGVALLIRAAAAALRPDRPTLGGSPVDVGFFLALIVTEAAWTVAFLLLNTERVELELRDALAQVKTLSGLLPICASCKKIRDDDGYWQQIEGYISSHSEAAFSHGICPECADRLYPGILGE